MSTHKGVDAATPLVQATGSVGMAHAAIQHLETDLVRADIGTSDPNWLDGLRCVRILVKCWDGPCDFFVFVFEWWWEGGVVAGTSGVGDFFSFGFHGFDINDGSFFVFYCTLCGSCFVIVRVWYGTIQYN